MKLKKYRKPSAAANDWSRKQQQLAVIRDLQFSRYRSRYLVDLLLSCNINEEFERTWECYEKLNGICSPQYLRNQPTT